VKSQDMGVQKEMWEQVIALPNQDKL